MQWAKNMRLNDAKKFVAKKLDLDVFDIADEAIMAEKRRELGIGVPVGEPGTLVEFGPSSTSRTCSESRSTAVSTSAT